MREYFANGETLPNGIYVQCKIYWDDCEMGSWPRETPWLATIGIGGWHYSSKGEETKEKAIKGLIEYMQSQVKQHKDDLERQKHKIEELTKFLQTEVNNGRVAS